jgi:hypothetical protein
MKEIDPLERLRRFVGEHETQRAAADALGISGPYLSDLLNGRREFSEPILQKLGLRRVVVGA